MLLGICVYGSLQALATGPIRQIHRNFSEICYFFAACVVALHWLGGFGPWSQKGAAVYSAGRLLYLIFSVPPLRPFRRWIWATSILGMVGCVAELVRFLFTVHD